MAELPMEENITECILPSGKYNPVIQVRPLLINTSAEQLSISILMLVLPALYVKGAVNEPSNFL